MLSTCVPGQLWRSMCRQAWCEVGAVSPQLVRLLMLGANQHAELGVLLLHHSRLVSPVHAASPCRWMSSEARP